MDGWMAGCSAIDGGRGCWLADDARLQEKEEEDAIGWLLFC